MGRGIVRNAAGLFGHFSGIEVYVLSYLRLVHLMKIPNFLALRAVLDFSVLFLGCIIS